MNSIIEFQIEFFKLGIKHIRPLTLKDIAEKLNLLYRDAQFYAKLKARSLFRGQLFDLFYLL